MMENKLRMKNINSRGMEWEKRDKIFIENTILLKAQITINYLAISK